MIKDVQTAVVEANYDWTIVKVVADEGVGYGECFFAPGLTAVIRELKPLVVGRDPTQIHAIMRLLRTAGYMASPHGGVLQHALAGIETALWDLLGKRLRVPLYELWGGAYRTRIRLYADCHGSEGLSSLNSVLAPRVPWWQSKTGETEVRWDLHPKFHGQTTSGGSEADVASFARRAQQAVAAGFTAVKFDADLATRYSRDDYNRVLSAQEVEYVEAVVRAVRDQVGNEVELAVDCHWNFDGESALKLAKAIAGYEILWLEDPVPPDHENALARVIAQSPVSIATGENHFSANQFLRLLQMGLHIAAPDVQKTGLAEGRRIAELAELFTVPVVLHNISGPIGTVAAAHLAAVIPNFLLLEHHAWDLALWEVLVRDDEGPVVQQGCVVLSNRPGLGISLDEEAAYRHRKKDERFF